MKSAMKTVLKTDTYTIFRKGSERYAIRGTNRAWINGDEKVRILVEHKLIDVAPPKPAEPEPADAAAEDASAADDSADIAADDESGGADDESGSADDASGEADEDDAG